MSNAGNPWDGVFCERPVVECNNREQDNGETSYEAEDSGRGNGASDEAEE